jgi:tetraacyldisaccharide 4'-kinase
MSHVFPPRKLLLPLVPIYQLGSWLRAKQFSRGRGSSLRLRFPVISIGNLSTGGAGKTPLTIALAKALTRCGFQVDVLSRGYGRRSPIPARVRPNGSADDFGDEPILIAQQAGVPVFVGARRYDAGLLSESDHGVETGALAQAPKPRIHLLDDGFQHRQLHRDVDILLLDRQDWEGGLLPAGNLREPVKAALRATVIAIPGEDEDLAEELSRWGWHGPVWRLLRKMKSPVVNGPVAAFCGIARPDQFFAGLESCGLQLAARMAFADHHRYTAKDIERLSRAAAASSATALVTTEKDMIRIGLLAATVPASLPLKTASLRVVIDAENQAIQTLVGLVRLENLRPVL